MNTLRVGKTRAAICTDLVPTAEFAKNPEWDADEVGLLAKIQGQIESEKGGENFFSAPALAWATQLMGDSIAANMMMLGAAWQRGWVPVSLQSLMVAIELNGVQVAQSKQAFEWGRRAAHDVERVGLQATASKASSSAASEAVVQWLPRQTQTIDELIAHRTALLLDYGGKRNGVLLAKRYQLLLAKVRAAQDTSQNSSDRLLRAVATQYFRLLAVKDEWEVARLYAAPEFAAQLKETFEGDIKLHFHLGAWPFAKKDPVTGHAVKVELGSWVMPMFRLVARLRGLRGSLFDPFRRSEERVLADQLLTQYEADMSEALLKLNAGNLNAVIQLANLPEKVKGYGHVRMATAHGVNTERLAIKESL
jgi:indolepyruvate ferredoxin oxidoreductase